MKYLSLFSGVGGFELGIQQAYEAIRDTDVSQVRGREKTAQGELQKDGEGLHTIPSETAVSPRDWDNELSYWSADQGQPTCIGFSEIDKYACQIYQRHFPDHINYGDITRINAAELPDFDLLCGGFPCQSFSIAGKRGGFADTRGTLFFDIARILRAKRPKLLLLENVKGLLSHDNGRTFATIISTLDELGYDLEWQVLNSKDFGVPQNRERVFIVGHLRGTSRPQVFPIGDAGQSSDAKLSSTTIDANYWKGIDNHGARTAIGHGDFITESRVKHGKAPYKMNYSPTLSAHWGTGGNNVPVVNAIRRLTPVECARLQGFPDDWHIGLSDTQAYKCYGNAVSVPVIKAIVARLLM